MQQTSAKHATAAAVIFTASLASTNKIIKKGVITDETRPNGHENTTLLDKLNRIIIANDEHYSKFKYDR